MHRTERGQGWAQASVIKDAGDDPDVTHGAEVVTRVEWGDRPGVTFCRGEGVGVVTKPGIGVPVGEPAINPVPRRMIEQALREAAGDLVDERGFRVTVAVPGGEEMARKTLNARLGILGGISILGTTGIVVPYSTAAFVASVRQSIDVALAAGCDHVVLTTGGRSEQYAMALLPLPEEAFIQMGEFIGFALQHARDRRVPRVSICGMVGKLSKVAAGHFKLHARASQVDPEFLAGVAAACGAPPDVVEEIRGANTARHFQEIVQARGLDGVFGHLAELVCRECRKYVGDVVGIQCLLVDFDGALLGRAAIGF
ncbi:MAG: cobalt-precorrin-5B (C(1))-methyltransferase [Clostridia bacterium]|nr:cobalt-precorrin-5B (C(1))-methyltransferase [Clostridia bacterium]